jgi:hypothetical protein
MVAPSPDSLTIRSATSLPWLTLVYVARDPLSNPRLCSIRHIFVLVYVIAQFVGDSAWLVGLVRRPRRVTKMCKSRDKCREGRLEVLARGHIGHACD